LRQIAGALSGLDDANVERRENFRLGRNRIGKTQTIAHSRQQAREHRAGFGTRFLLPQRFQTFDQTQARLQKRQKFLGKQNQFKLFAALFLSNRLDFEHNQTAILRCAQGRRAVASFKLQRLDLPVRTYGADTETHSD